MGYLRPVFVEACNRFIAVDFRSAHRGRPVLVQAHLKTAHYIIHSILLRSQTVALPANHLLVPV